MYQRIITATIATLLLAGAAQAETIKVACKAGTYEVTFMIDLEAMTYETSQEPSTTYNIDRIRKDGGIVLYSDGTYASGHATSTHLVIHVEQGTYLYNHRSDYNRKRVEGTCRKVG